MSKHAYGCVAFSPDGKYLASSSGKDIALLHARSGSLIANLRGYLGNVRSVAFSPDSLHLVSGSQDGTIRIWDVPARNERLKLDGHRGAVPSVAFSPSGERIASGGDDGTLRMWDATNGRQIALLPAQHGWVLSVAFTPDGTCLASGHSDGTIGLWDARSLGERKTLRGHSGRIWSLAFSPDGQRLASGAEDTAVKLWDPTTGEQVFTRHLTDAAVHSVAFSSDARRLMVGLRNGQVWVLDSGPRDEAPEPGTDAPGAKSGGKSRADQGTPAGAIKCYGAALRAADAKALRKCLESAGDTGNKIIGALTATSGTLARLRYVVVLKYGEKGEKLFEDSLVLAGDAGISDAAEEKADGDSPIVGNVRLVKVRDAWKIPVDQFIPGDGPDKAEKFLAALQRRIQAATQVREEIADNKHRTAQEALASFNRLSEAP